MPVQYMFMQYMSQTSSIFDRELKKGSAELLILSLLEARPRHGYEISHLIETRSDGALRFNIASFYPLLYRLERRGWIQGRWVEKEGQRRRRYYRLTAAGRHMLEQQRSTWLNFVAAMHRITGLKHA
jgi:PadR family transcriptional regulator, regulatory protein PadR